MPGKSSPLDSISAVSHSSSPGLWQCLQYLLASQPVQAGPKWTLEVEAAF